MLAYDAPHIERALTLAQRGFGATRPNPVVGAVLATGTQRIAEGWHQQYGGLHAEREVLDAVPDIPANATLYVTLEPCAHTGRQPPCADEIVRRGVRRVVIAADDPTSKTAGLGPALLERANVEVVWCGEDIAARARQQNAGFRARALWGRPYVTWKWAMTADRYLATGDPQRRWISNAASRASVHRMRAGSGAIAVGIDTLLVDDPQLTVRGEYAERMSTAPLRLVFDTNLRTPQQAALLRTIDQAPVVCVCAEAHADSQQARLLTNAGVAVWPVGTDNLAALFTRLAAAGVADVLVESGVQLATGLFNAGFIDRLVCFETQWQLDPREPDALPRLSAASPLFKALKTAVCTNVEGDIRREAIICPAPIRRNP